MLKLDNSVWYENHYDVKTGEGSVLGSEAYVNSKLTCLCASEQMIE